MTLLFAEDLGFILEVYICPKSSLNEKLFSSLAFVETSV